MSAVAREMLAAGPGCAIANGILNGFETTKVKLQLHNTKCAHHCPIYRNPTTLGVMTQIASEEGIVRGLMLPGLGASMTRSFLYGAYRVGLYSAVRDNLIVLGNRSSSSPQRHGAVAPPGGVSLLRDRIVSGMATGALGSLISCPLDVIRTRLQADAGNICPSSNTHYTTGLRRGQPVRYRGMWSALISILKTEGLRQGIYRGASVTVARASLLNGSQLASYDALKHALLLAGSNNNNKTPKEGPLLHAFCALISGIIAQTVVMPLDTIKSHMMLGNGWKDVVDRVRQPNTIRFLYRGYLPACAGQGCIMVLQMPLIEEFRRLLGVKPI